MQVVSAVDQGLVNNIRNGRADENHEDMMDDFLREYHLVAIPTVETVEGVLLQVAKWDLIQEPYFVIDCWRTLAADWDIEIDIRSIYAEAEPTAEKLLRSLLFGDLENLSTSERNVVRWLKKYIKQLKAETLKLLLQFLTGSNIIQGLKIRVMFHEHKANLSRAPIA